MHKFLILILCVSNSKESPCELLKNFSEERDVGKKIKSLSFKKISKISMQKNEKCRPFRALNAEFKNLNLPVGGEHTGTKYFGVETS